MKQVGKLQFAQLPENTTAMSIQEQMAAYAGTAPPIDGLCVFEAFEILSGGLGCNNSVQFFISRYMAAHGGWSSVWEYSYNASGIPVGVRAKGVSYQDAIAMLEENFHNSAIQISDIDDAVLGGSKVFAVLDGPSGTGHAVVITGYDPSTGEYTYQDKGGGGKVTINRLQGAGYSVDGQYN